MRRWVAIGGALVLAAVGAVLLVTYVQGAEERALEGQTLVSVFVVTEPIDKGTEAADLEGSVELRDIQTDNAADGVVSDLDDLTGLVAAVDLVPGEQVLLSRFETPAEASVATRIDVPAELLQATVSISPERAVGGRLVPGDLVAVIASFEPFDLGAVEPGDPQSLEDALDTIIVLPGDPGTPDEQGTTVGLQTPNSTKIIIHKVLVTGIQLEELPRESSDGVSAAVEFAPTGNLLITIAATAEDIEKIVFTAEHGTLWLALEDADAPVVETEIRTRGTIYE
jgi:pilus assembly protein CpaB